MHGLYEAVYAGLKAALKARASAPDSVDAAISRATDAIAQSRAAVDRAAAHSPVRRFNPQLHNPFRAPSPAQASREAARVSDRREVLRRLGEVPDGLGPFDAGDWVEHYDRAFAPHLPSVPLTPFWWPPAEDWAGNNLHYYGLRGQLPERPETKDAQSVLAGSRLPNPEVDAAHLYHQYRAPKRYPQAKNPNALPYNMTVPGEALIEKPRTPRIPDNWYAAPGTGSDYVEGSIRPGVRAAYLNGWDSVSLPYYEEFLRQWDAMQPYLAQQQRMREGKLRQPQTYTVSPNQAAEEGHTPSRLPTGFGVYGMSPNPRASARNMGGATRGRGRF